VMGVFHIGSLNYLPGLLLISASWVARITGMSHWCLAKWAFLKIILLAYNNCTGGYIMIFTFMLILYLS
jgi:hypothetical protein